MAARIMLINPLGVDIFDDITVEIVTPHLAAGTDLACTSLGDDAPRTPFLAPLHQIREPLVRRALAAQRDGFDVVAVSCSGDPCVAEVRAALDVPVVGALEAGCLTGRPLGKMAFMQRRLSEPYPSIMPTQRGSDWLVDKLAGYGLGRDDITVRPVRVPGHPDPDTVAAMADRDPDGLRELILTAMERAALEDGVAEGLAAAERDGARSLYFNCTFWGGLLTPVSAKVPVTVLDPLVTVARYAEYAAAVAA